jgi:hypothetical protein
VPDRALPTPQPPLTVRRVVDALASSDTFGGLTVKRVDDVLFVEFPAIRADGKVDRYLTKWSFAFYPEWPHDVTFVKKDTLGYDPAAWPKINNSSIFALHADYSGAPAGLICNSMFFAWYFYGGHGDQPGASWKPGVHSAIASVTELKVHLSQPYYVGPSSAGS